MSIKQTRSLFLLPVFAVMALALGSALAMSDGSGAQDPELPEDPFQRGLALYRIFRFQEAKTSFDTVLESQPDRKQALYHRGRTLLQLDLPGKAEQDFKQALKIDPEYAEGYIGLALAAIKLKHYDAAWNLNEKGAALNPDHPDVFYQKGLIFGYTDKTADAVAAFERCVELQPDFVYAHYQLGMAYNQQKRFDLTIVHLTRFLELAPQAPEAPQVRNLLEFLRRH